jgi:hypothetical protein
MTTDEINDRLCFYCGGESYSTFIRYHTPTIRIWLPAKKRRRRFHYKNNYLKKNRVIIHFIHIPFGLISILLNINFIILPPYYRLHAPFFFQPVYFLPIRR